MARRVIPILLLALALASCGGSDRLDAKKAASLVTKSFVRIEGVRVASVSCEPQAAPADARVFLCQTGTLLARPVDALVTEPAGGGAARAQPTLSVGRLGRLIEQSFHGPDGPGVLAAPCPRGVPYRRGAVTDCEVAFLGGERVKVRVTQLDDRGKVRIRTTTYVATELAHTIERRLRAHGIRAAVSCPRGVPIASDASFLCSLARGGRRVRVLASDGRGGVHFRLPPG